MKKHKTSNLRSEDSEQEAVIEYCRLRSIPIIHIPNEGKRSASYGAKMKRMGLAKGFPDLFIPEPINGAHGLFIELKADNGKISKDQEEWLMLLSKKGYRSFVCRGFNAAKSVIEKYLKGD